MVREAARRRVAAEGSPLVARDEMWLAGVPYLTIHNQICRRRRA